MRTWTSLVVLVGLAFLCFSGELPGHVLATSGDAESIERFASIISGKFNNREQVENTMVDDQPTRDYSEIEWIPIYMKAFGQKPTFHFVHTFNTYVVRHQIMVVEPRNLEMIELKTYNATVSDPSKLEDLTMDDLQEAGCDPRFYELTKGNYLAAWPACLLYLPESLMSHPAMFSCEAIGFLRLPFPDNVGANNTHVAYKFRPVTRHSRLGLSTARGCNYCGK